MRNVHILLIRLTHKELLEKPELVANERLTFVCDGKFKSDRKCGSQQISI